MFSPTSYDEMLKITKIDWFTALKQNGNCESKRSIEGLGLDCGTYQQYLGCD